MPVVDTLWFRSFLLKLRRRIEKRFKGSSSRSFDKELIPRLFVRQLEDRRVLNAHALPFQDVARTIVVDAVLQGHGDTFQVSRQGNQVDIAVDGKETVTANLRDVGAIQLRGSSNQDAFIIDFSGGDPVPSGGIQVIGGSPAGAADTLVLQSTPTGLPIRSLTDQIHSGGAGSIQLRFNGSPSTADTITYTGVGLIKDSMRTQNVAFVDDVAGDSLSFDSQPGVGGLAVASAKATSIELSSSPDSLTVDTSGHAGVSDAIRIAGIETYSPLDLSVHTAAGDSIRVGGYSNLDGGNLTVTGGSIEVDGALTSRGGTVTLDAGSQGTLLDYGTIDVSNPMPGQKGGKVELLGDYVGLLDQARVDASGDGGGGTVLIGGDYHGANPEVLDASFTYVGSNVRIAADGLTQGDGGHVAVWSNVSTQFFGSISARGGSLSGDGGFVETSGKEALQLSGSQVTASAFHGNPGTWLFDPWNVNISADPTSAGGFVGGVFVPSGTGATVNNSDIVNELNSGTNVTISTDGSGPEAGNISVNAPIVWNSAAQLILDAAGSMSVNEMISNRGTGDLELDAAFRVTISAAIQLAGSLQVTVGAGTIAENGAGMIAANLLTTSSWGGTTLNGANAVTGFRAMDILGGAIQLTNDTELLSVTGVSEGGNVQIVNSGAIGVTGVVAAGADKVTLAASGTIAESGSGAIECGLLTTSSSGGTILDGANAVTGFHATNTVRGGVLLTNNWGILSVAGVSESGGGDIVVFNGGAIGVTGVLAAGAGNVTLSATGMIGESGAGAITGDLLTTSSSGGTSLDGANAVMGFNATNATSGDFRLVNSDALSVTGISQAAGTNVTITNTGSVGINGLAAVPSGDLTITATDAVSQTAAIMAGVLTVKTTKTGGAPITLIDSFNAVDTIDLLARNATDTANDAGTISYRGAAAFAVAEVQTTADVTLQNAGTVTETGAILASGLELLGSGGYTLTNSGNHVSTLAGSTTGNISYYDSGSFAIGSKFVAASVDLTASGDVIFATTVTPSVQTSGSQTYNAAVQLKSDTVLVSTDGGNLTFNATVDGHYALETDTAGNAVFNGLIGGAVPLTSLTTDAAAPGGHAQFNMTAAGGGSPAGVNAATVTIDEAAVFNVGGSTANSPSVKTSGAQTYNGAVQLQSDTALVTTGGAVDFNSTIDSGKNPANLTINATGTIYFGNNVGLAAPLKSLTAWPNNGVTIASGHSINTVTGAVSSAPPVLFVFQTSPSQENVNASQLTQTVYGYIGYLGAPSGYTELGQNYNIEVHWADGTVTMSNTQNLPIAGPSTGYGAFVGYGTEVTMTSSPGSQGVWTYNNKNAALPAFFPPAGSTNGITFAVSHTYGVSFVFASGRSSLTAVIELSNNSSIQLSNPASDGDIATVTPPAATSLNAVQTTTTVPITATIVPASKPPAFVPPPSIEAPVQIAAPVVASTPPLQTVNALNDLNPPRDTVIAERRMIEIVKLDADGVPENGSILSDVPEKLNELLGKLRRGDYRNGRYAVYLAEYSVGDNKLLGRRLLMDLYKSGKTLGDPVHEPGPGSNPLPEGNSNQEAPAMPNRDLPKPGARPTTQIVPLGVRTDNALAAKEMVTNGFQDSHVSGTLRVSTSSGTRNVPDTKTRSATASPGNVSTHKSVLAILRASVNQVEAVPPSYIALRYPMLGAAVAAIGGLGTQSLQGGWAQRVDRALGNSQVKSLRHMARFAGSSRACQD